MTASGPFRVVFPDEVSFFSRESFLGWFQRKTGIFLHQNTPTHTHPFANILVGKEVNLFVAQV